MSDDELEQEWPASSTRVISGAKERGRGSGPVPVLEGGRGSGPDLVGQGAGGQSHTGESTGHFVVCFLCVSCGADLDSIARDLRTFKAQITLVFMDDCTLGDGIRQRLKAERPFLGV